MRVVYKEDNERYLTLSELKLGHVYKLRNHDSIYTPISEYNTIHLYLLNLSINIFYDYNEAKEKELNEFVEVSHRLEISRKE